MRSSIILFLCIVIPGILLYAGVGQIKKSNLQTQYYQHDRNKALTHLTKDAGHEIKVTWNKYNSTPTFVGGKLTKPGYAAFSQWSAEGIRFISENSQLFGLKEPEKELQTISAWTDELKMTHVKYEQRIDGIKVSYSNLIVHFNSDGSIESVNGNYVPTPEINLIPKVDAAAAQSIAEGKINYLPTAKYCEMVVYHKDNSPMLAYEIKLPGKFSPGMTIFVDAQNGEVLKMDNGLRYDGFPMKGTGIGLDGKLKNIESYLYGGKYYLIDITLPMFVPAADSLIGTIETWDAQNDTAGNGYQKAVYVTDPNNDNFFNDNERLKAAVDAHYYTRIVYNFYRSHYNRNSFDDKGSTLINAVHYKEKYNNAFWNGAFMSYGDGDGEIFTSLAGALDVIGHEITHGVVQYTADLKYELQPGAINESIADVFGVMMDSTDWQIGEDIATPNIPGDAIRNMADPHNGQITGDIMKGWQPEHMNEYMIYPNDEDHDWGGVHVNSGILNKAFYNTVVSIGHWKSGKIWYRCLTVYLTQNSQFDDLVSGCQNSAKDLYGDNSPELKAVTDAFAAVGLIIVPPPVPEKTDLVYDDGEPSISVYEEYPMWQLGVRFSPANKDYSVTQVQVYTAGDYYNGTGQYKLGIYKADPATGLPGEGWLHPTNQIPVGTGWQVYDIYGGGTYTGDFYVTVLYDGAGCPLIGADSPPGNGRAYEYDLTKHSWVQLVSPNDFTLFMRATVVSSTATIVMDNERPADFKLEQNYPNPFNPETTIRYSLPVDTEVKMIVYDLNGNRVAELVNNYQSAGNYSITWNGRNESGAQAASGIYYYRITAGNYSSTTKMCLLK